MNCLINGWLDFEESKIRMAELLPLKVYSFTIIYKNTHLREISLIWKYLFPLGVAFDPIALRKAKIVYNFGSFECSRF